MTTKSALSTLVMARILGRRPVFPLESLGRSQSVLVPCCSAYAAYSRRTFFSSNRRVMSAMSFMSLCGSLATRRLRGSSFASRVRGAIVGSELFVELLLEVAPHFIY
jgi:hypothetical protein